MTSEVIKGQKVILKFSKSSISSIYFLFNAKSFKNFSKMSTLRRRKFFFKLYMTFEDIQCKIRPLLCQNHSSTFVYGPILMKIGINDNIMTR